MNRRSIRKALKKHYAHRYPTILSMWRRSNTGRKPVKLRANAEIFHEVRSKMIADEVEILNRALNAIGGPVHKFMTGSIEV